MKTIDRQEYPYKRIGDRLKWHRNFIGMTQQEYADVLDMRRPSYTQWENGYQRLSLNGAMYLKQEYGLTLDFLYFGEVDTLPLGLRQAFLESQRVEGSE